MNFVQFSTYMQQMLVTTDFYGQQMFNSLLPMIITFAENLIYREPDFDFLSTRTSDITQTTTTGARSVPIPPQFLIVENVNLITPAGANPNSPGYQRVPLLRTSRAFIDATWPQESATATPAPFENYWAIFSQDENLSEEGEYVIPNNIIIAPTPDNQYTVEFLGVFQPAPLSAANPTTFLTAYFPDLFLASAMMQACGSLLKNYGAQSDDPRQALSWKAVYDEIKSGVSTISFRQKSTVEGFSPYPSNPTMPNIAALQQAAAAHAAQAG